MNTRREPSSLLRAIGRAAEGMPAGAFAFVMATGIVSTAFWAVGWGVLSLVLLVVAVAALVVLAAALVWRFARSRADCGDEARDPRRAFGYFTIVAAINVVGIRLYPVAPEITVVLAIVSVPVWLLCSYGVPSNLMLRPKAGPVAADVDGSWFLWVVGTQSLATAAAAIGLGGDHVIAAVAVALWGIGVMLYIMLATLVTLRLLTVPSTPTSFKPSYWIYMGATAITVLAGSRILRMPSELPIMDVTAPVVSGLTYVLWAFGVWWVPLLVIFGVWRHIVHRESVRFEGGLWSIVFPLGMYSVASIHFGGVSRLPLLVAIGDVGTAIAGVVWLLVTAAMVRAAVLWLRTVASPLSRASGER